MKTLLLFLATFLSIACHAQQGTLSQKQHAYVALELDPAPFLLGGYSFSVKYSPKKLPKFAITSSVYASRFPDKLMKKSNYEKCFRNLHIETSYAVFGDYFFRKSRTGFHVGPSLFLYKKSVGMERTGLRTTFNTLYPNIRFGYIYQPFSRIGFYVNPWISLGSERNLDSQHQLQEISFKANTFQYIMALHVGYRFNFSQSN